MATKKLTQYIGTGRRKSAVASVFLRPGKGNITVNRRELADYFPIETARMVLLQPLDVVDMMKKFDILVMVRGGGISGQAGAVKLAIARALVNYDEQTGTDSAAPEAFRRKLRADGPHLTRDARIVERKKVGRPKARRGKQFSKR